MNKYQSYKPSGVEWIGKIPEEWSIIKLGYLGKLKSGNGFSENLQGREIGGDFPFFKVSDTNNEGNEMYLVRGNNYVSNDDYIENKWYLFPKHTVVFPKIGMVLLMNKRRILNQPSFIDNNMMGFIPNSHIQFLFSFYLLKLIDFKNYCSDGTVPSIGESQISSIKVVLPPLEQQHQIVQFLDEKTELIDKLISTKERKITLLKEQRTSVINQIVTKGLNPNVKMKDSGVEWIGEIPEHWRFIKFSYLIIKSDLGGNYESSTENDGVPLIKMGNLGRGKVNLNKVEYLNESEQYDKNHILEFGDFLFNTRNSVDLVGKVSLWRRELDFSLYNSNILRIKFKEGVENEFMCYLFNSQSLLDVLKLISKGTTSVSGIYFKDLSEIKIPIPKLEEQLQIVEHLDSKTKEIDDLVSLEQRKIDLLKEYRQSLISEVVTGKIKVTTDE